MKHASCFRKTSLCFKIGTINVSTRECIIEACFELFVCELVSLLLLCTTDFNNTRYTVRVMAIGCGGKALYMTLF